jgi:hypothetical protein
MLHPVHIAPSLSLATCPCLYSFAQIKERPEPRPFVQRQPWRSIIDDADEADAEVRKGLGWKEVSRTVADGAKVYTRPLNACNRTLHHVSAAGKAEASRQEQGRADPKARPE